LSATGGSTNSIDYFQYINADKFITQGGTSSQYLKGDGSLALFPDNIVYTSGNQTISGVKTFSDLPFVNGTGVSISGHTHTASNITNFNSSVSGLLSGVQSQIDGKADTSHTHNGSDIIITDYGGDYSSTIGDPTVSEFLYNMSYASVTQNYGVGTVASRTAQNRTTLGLGNVQNLALSGITFTAGSGLAGGGSLANNRTFDIGQGDGITVSADSIAVNNTVVRTTGASTSGYLPRWNSTNGLNNSLIFDNGTNVGIGTTTPSGQLHVIGTGIFSNKLGVGISGFPTWISQAATPHTFVHISGVSGLFPDANERVLGSLLRLNNGGSTNNPRIDFRIGGLGNYDDQFFICRNGTDVIGIDTSNKMFLPNGFTILNPPNNGEGSNASIRSFNDAASFVTLDNNTKSMIIGYRGKGAGDQYIDVSSSGRLKIYNYYSEVATFDNRGRFGIGTTSPSGQLHVVGTGIFNSGIYVSDITNQTYINGNNTVMDFFVGNNRGMRLSTYGTLAINRGTASALGTLHVQGNGSNPANTSDPMIVTSSVGSGSIIRFTDSASNDWQIGVNPNGSIQSGSGSGNFAITRIVSNSGVPSFTINSIGNIVIGTGVSLNSSDKLTVEGNIKLGDIAGTKIQFYRGGGTIYDYTMGKESNHLAISTANDGTTFRYAHFGYHASNGTWNPKTVINGFNGNVGIGTTTPIGQLHVIGSGLFSGDVTANGSFIGGSGTAALPSFDFTGDPDTGLFSPASNTIAISTSGVERLRINDIGNVGINTTVPQNGFKLDVNGAAVIRGSILTNSTISEFGNSRYQLHSGASSNQVSYVCNGGGRFGVGFTAPSGLVAISGGVAIGSNYNSTPPTNGLIVEGNVGIGTTTPSSQLHVIGSGVISSGLIVNGNLTFDSFTESVVAIGNSSTSQTISLTSGTVQTCTLTGNCTFTMPTATAGKSFSVFLNTGSGGYTATFTGVRWNNSTAPTITSTASKVDLLSFISDGTYWYGSFSQNYG
jgi:hypothetical protein